MSDSISVKSVARGVSECEPILLSVSSDNTRRLVFLPIIHNDTSKKGTIRGCFIYQRKFKKESWERITNDEEKLSKLKSGEGYRLDLKTNELQALLAGLSNIKQIEQHVRSGHTNTIYIPTTSDVAPLLRQLLEGADDKEIIREINLLGGEQSFRLSDLIANAKIRKTIEYWKIYKSDSNENNWQNFFTQRPWIFSLVSDEPIIILREKMYVGGTNATGRGGKNIDYAYLNKQTRNVALIEIKTPQTSLLSTEYRDIFPPGREITGAVTQVQNYKYNLLKNIRELKEEYSDFDAVNIPTYVIAGNTDQLVNDSIKKRSFDLFRKNLKETIILTYDELFERLKINLSPYL